MNIALLIVCSMLTLASIGSGFAKFKKIPAVMESMKSVGVKSNLIPILAILEIAGGLGLVFGIWNKPLGVLSASCLSLYFLGAFLSHVRKKHGLSEFGPALFILLIAVVTSVLQFNR